MNIALPKIPGYKISHDPTKFDFKRVSSIIMDNNRYDENKLAKSVSISNDFYNPLEIKVRLDKSKSVSQSVHTNLSGPEVTEQFQPYWSKLDKKVLRFWGFFKESVEESSVEKFRIRKLTLYYYLVDDTILITEGKEINTGIPSGTFLNRGKIKNENGQFITSDDLFVGENLYIHGRYISLYDCDDYTRTFYKMKGIEQKDRIEPFKDTFHENKDKKPEKNKDNSMNEYLEYKLGGGKQKNLIQFFENDRKVLKFYCLSESLNYIVHYFLSDDTIEIREVYTGNNGIYPFPLFLKRSRLPRKYSIQQPGVPYASEFYHASDLEQSSTIWAYNRPFKILGCDKFTQDYFLKKYNRKFIVSGFEEPEPMKNKEIVFPPYTGYGSEDDISSCLHLHPKTIVKRYDRYFDNISIVLRFLAKLDSKSPYDVERKFLISFFLCDNTLQVYEIPSKNSGNVEGRFLERKKYKNPANDGKYFEITDFELNKSLKINSFSFFIYDADDYTKNWQIKNLI